MFPEWLRRLTRWLPFQFITYAPARAFVDFAPAFVIQAKGILNSHHLVWGHYAIKR